MPSLFPTTRRSVVHALSSDDAQERTRAFDTLVAIYWKPLYKFARMTWNRTAEDAEDLTQGFFAKVFEAEALKTFDPRKAAFRTYLRMLFERYAANEAKAASRLKRGGATTTLDFAEAEAELTTQSPASPEDLFYRDWVKSVFALAVERMRDALTSDQMAIFEAYDLGDDRNISYRELAAQFNIRETAITNHLHAARKKFRESVLDTLREATATEDEFRAEARALLGVDA